MAMLIDIANADSFNYLQYNILGNMSYNHVYIQVAHIYSEF